MGSVSSIELKVKRKYSETIEYNGDDILMAEAIITLVKQNTLEDE